MAASSIAGGCSGVTVHACMAADSLLASPPAAAETTPMRSDEALTTRNFANAVTGDTQNQVLPGALLPRAEDKRAAWLIEAVNKAAWSGSSKGTGANTPMNPAQNTPMSRHMLSACATPPGTPGTFHPHRQGMEDVRDKVVKKRDAPEQTVGKS